MYYSHVNNIISFFEGKRSGQHIFFSPTKGKYISKGCVMIRRALFPSDIILEDESILPGGKSCKYICIIFTRDY